MVVLHGCTQTAEAYDTGAGWSRLAEEYGFALLFPEQQRQNNPNLCFNWFERAHARRDQGEALSIRQMIATMVTTFDLGSDRVFITGLSAGGAMAAVMLATYPEVFAGGAIIAGLPFGSAQSATEAFRSMRGRGRVDSPELAAAVRDASNHRGPWPTMTVWHGTSDSVVNPSNADALVGQWAAVTDLDLAASENVHEHGLERQTWFGPDGRPMLQFNRVVGMGHGTPIKEQGTDNAGVAGPFMLEAGVSSSRDIIRFWDIMADERVRAPVVVPFVEERKPEVEASAEGIKTSPLSAAILHRIETAMRAAGLMR